jgi:hypothetical protein
MSIFGHLTVTTYSTVPTSHNKIILNQEQFSNIVDPDLVGSEIICRIRIRRARPDLNLYAINLKFSDYRQLLGLSTVKFSD